MSEDPMRYAIVAVDRRTGKAKTLAVLRDPSLASKTASGWNMRNPDARHASVPFESIGEGSLS